MISSRETSGQDDVVVLVDAGDVALGIAPKLVAHREGRLHRAVSVVLFDDNARLLLQQRAGSKYHSGGLWSNTCCGHPRPGEPVTAAGRRRLNHELGITDCELMRVSEFVYYAKVDEGLVEHELDHVLVGLYSGEPRPNPSEVAATRWIEPATLFTELVERPDDYTAWTKSVISHACRFIEGIGA